MKIIVVGDLRPYRAADMLAEGFAALPGLDVVGYPENQVETWRSLADPDHLADVDVVVWSRSRALWQRYDQGAFLHAARQAGTPVVGFHLDRWWGLRREAEIAVDPFFRSDVVVTTHDTPRWAAAGVRHVWMPPATREADARLVGGVRADAVGKIVFVGSWERYPHPEWSHRLALISRLRRRFGPMLVCYPNAGPVHGQDLADIYASASVVVGDSCLIGGGGERYWSDRVPVALGAGAVLVHPVVDGMAEHFTPGEHFVAGSLDIDAFGDAVEHAMNNPVDGMGAAGRAAVLDGHTYTVRARQILDYLRLGGDAPAEPAPEPERADDVEVLDTAGLLALASSKGTSKKAGDRGAVG